MVQMLAPPGVTAGATVQVLSGAVYTVDSNLFISVSSQFDAVNLQNMGFTRNLPGGRNNYTATVDPAVGNDNTQDYASGSWWINTTASPDRAWICVSAATGAAVWLQASIGALIGGANTASIGGLDLSGLITRSAAAGVTAFSGGGQSSATQLTTDFSNITTATAASAPYDSVKFSVNMVPGQKFFVANNAANPVQLFGQTGDSINGFATGTGVTLPVGFFGDVVCPVGGALQIKNLPTFTSPFAYNTNNATSGATLTAANISGGTVEVTLNLTGTLSGVANAQLPLVSSLVAAIPNAVAGLQYKLQVINSSSANHAWTVTTNTGWTLSGTMSINQNTTRDFYLTLTSLTAATLQSVDTGTYS
jgi:hypothetical protein